MSTIDHETAELEFARFVRIWDIKGDTEGMSAKDKESFLSEKERIVDGLQAGDVTIGEDGEFIYRLRFIKDPERTDLVKEVVLKVERASLLSMDKHGDQEQMHKIQSYMASLAGVAPKFMASVDPRDQKILRSVALLFLGS